MIEYWRRPDTDTKSAGQRALGRDDNKALYFLQKEDGSFISNSEAISVRKAVHAAFGGLVRQGLAPETFGTLCHNGLVYFEQCLTSQYPYIRLCEGQWKLRRIGSMNYSAWYGNNRHRFSDANTTATTTVKPEPDATTTVKHKQATKRPLLEGTNSSQAVKRPRVEPPLKKPMDKGKGVVRPK